MNACLSDDAPSAADATARALADFTHALQLRAVPGSALERARHLMLDAMGCALAARGEDFSRRLGEAIRSVDPGAPGARGVPGHASRLAMRDAIWLSGVLMHGLDYDDTHLAGVVHLSVAVLPAVLVLGAQRRASGAELLTAYVAGLECGARVASVVRGGLHAQGFHPTGVVGCFAAALACGKLMRLDAAQLVAAQGLALSLASGNLQFLEDGAWTKRLHPGWAAQAGLQAAHLAAHGIPAPSAPYEGRYGLFRAYLAPELQRQTVLALGREGLGQVWETEQIAVKPFPMCHFVHAAADAAIALHRQGIRPGDVARIDALMPTPTLPVVCEPIAAKRRPQSDYDAKFSLPYAVASGLLRGRLGLAELQVQSFTDPHALALMDRVYPQADPDSSFPRHYGATLRVTLANGEVVTCAEPVNRGHAERPLTNAEVVAKYRDNATLNFDAAYVDALQHAVLDLPAGDALSLETLLARDP